MSFFGSLTNVFGGRDGQARSVDLGVTRRDACQRVVRRFAREHGAAASSVAKREEVERLIAQGIEPMALRHLLQQRLVAAPGVLLGERRVAGRMIEVRLPQSLRLQHTITTGRSGAGKTTLARHVIQQDALAGNGLGVIALELELIRDEIAPTLPPERWDDVVLIDPADPVQPVPYNPLHLEPGEDIDLKASQLNVTLKRLWSEEGATGAPRLELIASMATYGLLSVPGTTLLDVERLVDRTDPSFRQWVIANTPDERTRHFWASTYESLPRDAHLSLLNRLGRLLRPRAVRNLLCQPTGSFNFRQAMDSGKIVLIVLSDATLGEDTSALLANLFAAQFQLAAMSRADVPPSQRRPFYLYLDEAQRSAGVAETSFEQMFARARKYALGLNLFFQHFGQMPESLVRDMLGTAGTIISFQTGGTDARRLARELVGHERGQVVGVHPDVLVSLPIGQAICRVGRNVFRLHGQPPLTGGDPDAYTEILRRSRQSHGVAPKGTTTATPLSAPPQTGGVL